MSFRHSSRNIIIADKIKYSQYPRSVVLQRTLLGYWRLAINQLRIVTNELIWNKLRGALYMGRISLASLMLFDGENLTLTLFL